MSEKESAELDDSASRMVSMVRAEIRVGGEPFRTYIDLNLAEVLPKEMGVLLSTEILLDLERRVLRLEGYPSDTRE